MDRYSRFQKHIVDSLARAGLPSALADPLSIATLPMVIEKIRERHAAGVVTADGLLLEVLGPFGLRREQFSDADYMRTLRYLEYFGELARSV